MRYIKTAPNVFVRHVLDPQFFRFFMLTTKSLERNQKKARWLRHNVVQIRCLLPSHLFLPIGESLTTRKTKDLECTCILQPVWHHLVELHARRNRRDCIVSCGGVQFTARFFLIPVNLSRCGGLQAFRIEHVFFE